ADQRIAAIMREIANHTGTRIDPGGAPRHIAVMAWDPGAEANDPGVQARRAEIAYGTQVVLYPPPSGDHSALALLLAAWTDTRFPAPGSTARPGGPGRTAGEDAGPDAQAIPVTWVPAAEPAAHFTGRAEELARLDRWAADPRVSLVGVTA